MKICIAITDRENNEPLIFPDFFNAEAYCICNSSKGTKEVYSRERILQAFAVGAKKPFDAILTSGIKPMAFNILRTQKIPVFIPKGNSISENMLLLIQNKLKLLQKEDVQPASACDSTACSTCSTSCN